MDVLLSNPEMVEKLEQCVMNWQTQITIVIEEQQNKKPQVCDSPCMLSFNTGRLGGVTVYRTSTSAEGLEAKPSIHTKCYQEIKSLSAQNEIIR